MEPVDLARAWRDDAYRASLPSDVREKLPQTPDGVEEMSDEELRQAAGAVVTWAAPVLGTMALAGGGAALWREISTNDHLKHVQKEMQERPAEEPA